MSKKFSAIDELEYIGTEQGDGDGIIVNEQGLSSNVSEIITSFHSYNEVISDMATQTLISINYHLNNGCSEQDILDEFNKHMTSQPYKNMKELIKHFQNIGI